MFKKYLKIFLIFIDNDYICYEQNIKTMEIFNEGDNVIIIDSPSWKSVIGKSAVVVRNDANPNFGEGHKKIKIDYEDGAVGWFWPAQLQLDNDITSVARAKRHLTSLLKNEIVTDGISHVRLETKHVEQLLNVLKKMLHNDYV